MAKTNAEKQDYRERKKLVIDEFLEKERKTQKKYYVKKNKKTPTLWPLFVDGIKLPQG